MIFRQLFDRETCTYTYLLGDETSRRAVLSGPHGFGGGGGNV